MRHGTLKIFAGPNVNDTMTIREDEPESPGVAGLFLFGTLQEGPKH